jgi:D-3-phosphoglycerate dehydrogenase
MQIGILEPNNFSLEALTYLKRLGEVRTYDGGDLPAFLAPLEVLFVRLGYRIDNTFLSLSPRLRWLCSPTTGHNHIDEEALTARDVRILSLRGERDFLETIRATPEHTLGLVIAIIRRYRQAFEDVVTGRWDRNVCRGDELYGNRVGIVGLGRVGYRLACYLSALGAYVSWCDPVVDVTSLQEWQRYSDIPSLIEANKIIILCADHRAGQLPVIGKKEFDAMEGCYFINTARGELVDEDAFLAAVRSNRLAGTAIDVIANENGESRLAEWRELMTGRNLILTPHIAGATFDSMAKTELFIAKKLNTYRMKLNSDINMGGADDK